MHKVKHKITKEINYVEIVSKYKNKNNMLKRVDIVALVTMIIIK